MPGGFQHPSGIVMHAGAIWRSSCMALQLVGRVPEGAGLTRRAIGIALQFTCSVSYDLRLIIGDAQPER